MHYLPAISECGSIADNIVDMLCTRQVMSHTEKHCNRPDGECPQGYIVSGLHLQNAVLSNLCPIFLLWLYYLGDFAVPFDMRQGLENSVHIISIPCTRIFKLGLNFPGKSNNTFLMQNE
jgi:hypothetical protein